MNITLKKCLNGTQLKLIAMVLMVLDHIYEFFSFTGSVPIWFTWLGRLVFPIFMFTMAEGFHYTKSKGMYLRRLYIGSAVMGILNCFFVFIFPRHDNLPIFNNIFGTFFLTVYYLYYFKNIKENKIQNISIKKDVLMLVVPILLGCIFLLTSGIFKIPVFLKLLYYGLLPSPLFVEGGPFLVILGIIMYYTRHNRSRQVVFYIIFCLSIVFSGEISIENLLYKNYQWMMVFSAIFMLMYNEEKGKGYKYLFYIFYPVHIYILYLLSLLVI